MVKTERTPSLKSENGKFIWLLVNFDIIAMVLVLTGFVFTQESLVDIAQSSLIWGVLLAAAGPLVFKKRFPLHISVARATMDFLFKARPFWGVKMKLLPRAARLQAACPTTETA